MRMMSRLWMLVCMVLFNSVWRKKKTYTDYMYHCRCNLVPVYHYINIHRYRARPRFLKYALGQLLFIVSTRFSIFPSFLPPTQEENQTQKTKNQKPKNTTSTNSNSSPHDIVRAGTLVAMRTGTIHQAGKSETFFSGGWWGVYCIIQVPCNYFSPFFFSAGGAFIFLYEGF